MCPLSGFGVAKPDITKIPALVPPHAPRRPSLGSLIPPDVLRDARSLVPIASRSTRALRSFAMSPLLKRLLRNPAFLVGFAAFLAALLVQSGEIDSINTVRMLQTTHSFWTSAPPVAPDDYPDFGVPGRNGRIYAWYGIGQSLLMLPADIVGTYLADTEWFKSFSERDPGIREIVVSYSTNILLCVLAVLVCLRFLRLLEFTNPQAIAGAFTLLFGTTFLHYTQNMMENNFLMLFTLSEIGRA